VLADPLIAKEMYKGDYHMENIENTKKVIKQVMIM
jgi:hypothetical protein